MGRACTEPKWLRGLGPVAQQIGRPHDGATEAVRRPQARRHEDRGGITPLNGRIARTPGALVQQRRQPDPQTDSAGPAWSGVASEQQRPVIRRGQRREFDTNVQDPGQTRGRGNLNGIRQDGPAADALALATAVARRLVFTAGRLRTAVAMRRLVRTDTASGQARRTSERADRQCQQRGGGDERTEHRPRGGGGDVHEIRSWFIARQDQSSDSGRSPRRRRACGSGRLWPKALSYFRKCAATLPASQRNEATASHVRIRSPRRRGRTSRRIESAGRRRSRTSSATRAALSRSEPAFGELAVHSNRTLPATARNRKSVLACRPVQPTLRFPVPHLVHFLPNPKEVLLRPSSSKNEAEQPRRGR